ncbi:DUF6009 family protein [Streptomyces anulatus]
MFPPGPTQPHVRWSVDGDPLIDLTARGHPHEDVSDPGRRVWRPTRYTWVRSRKPVGWNGTGRRVGCSVLKSDAPSGDTGRFVRRVFWVKDYDRSEQPDGMYKTSAPSEAVDPRTVAPGVLGELTERAWGGPLPD